MASDKPAAGERPRVTRGSLADLRGYLAERLASSVANGGGSTLVHNAIVGDILEALDQGPPLVFVDDGEPVGIVARAVEQPPATRGAEGYPPWVGQDDLACPRCGGTLSVPGDTYFDGNLYDAHCYECNVDIDVEASVEIKFCVRSDDGDE